jgi:hypothetical protein
MVLARRLTQLAMRLKSRRRLVLLSMKHPLGRVYPVWFARPQVTGYSLKFLARSCDLDAVGCDVILQGNALVEMRTGINGF